MTRVHPLFGVHKGSGPSGSQGAPKSEGNPVKIVKKHKQREGFGSLDSGPDQAGNPTSSTSPNVSNCEIPSAVITKQPTKNDTQSPVCQVPNHSNNGWNSNCKWTYPSTSSTVKQTLGTKELIKKIYGNGKDESLESPPVRLVRIPVTVPKTKEQSSNKNCWGRCCMKIRGAKKQVRRLWRILKRSKKKWDKWNPNKSHPIAACIDESKLAGLKETIKPNRGILYRIMWLVVFFTALGIATKMAYNTYNFHQETPILYAFDNQEITVDKLAAPTITVCPSAAYKTSAVTQAAENYETQVNTNTKDYKTVFFMKNSCEPKTIQSSRHELGHFNRLASFGVGDEYRRERDDGDDEEFSKHVIPFMKKASHDCGGMLKFCSWNMITSDTCDDFTPTFETTGGCCSFNNLPDSLLYKGKKSLKTLWSKGNDDEKSRVQERDWGNWTLQQHLRHVHDERSKAQFGPKRQSDGGWPWGASFVVIMDDNDYDCPQFDSSGTRISISVPGVDVDVERENILIPPNHEVFIRIFPEVTLADEDLRTIAPVARGCYMENEKKLTHYNSYNQENCHRECVAEYILKTCDCVLLSFPNSEGQEICTKWDLGCVRRAEGEVVRDIGLPIACPSCLPTCSHMTLRLETTMSPYSQHHVSEMNKSLNKTTSLVHTFYGPKSVTAKVRKLRHSKYEFYSEAGSIYETTNDMSLMGYVRIICGSQAFLPGVIATLLLLRAYCLRCPVVCRKFNICAFGLRRKLKIHPTPEQPNVDPVSVEGVAENEVVNSVESPTNFEIFLAESSHICIEMPPSNTNSE